MNPQTHGMEQIEGTYLFDLRTSNRALRLNRFFWHMIRALWRDRFLQDAEVLMQEADLHRAGEGADPRARLAWPGAVRCQLFRHRKIRARGAHDQSAGLRHHARRIVRRLHADTACARCALSDA
ncbi:protocatechuate degradation protein [Xanthomonas oryzae pv. oryzae MAFF 311018]|nr:protocatechuate degradation protein [Xanthomonas oryzae pv. oryzae MAFF 311018]